jgi:hypothetical protein
VPRDPNGRFLRDLLVSTLGSVLAALLLGPLAFVLLSLAGLIQHSPLWLDLVFTLIGLASWALFGYLDSVDRKRRAHAIEHAEVLLKERRDFWAEGEPYRDALRAEQRRHERPPPQT